jgi:hypothetical protein
MIWYDMIYDMIYLTAIGLPLGGSDEGHYIYVFMYFEGARYKQL